MGVLGCVICVAGYPLSVSGTHTRPLKGETSSFLPPLHFMWFCRIGHHPHTGRDPDRLDNMKTASMPRIGCFTRPQLPLEPSIWSTDLGWEPRGGGGCRWPPPPPHSHVPQTDKNWPTSCKKEQRMHAMKLNI